MAKEDDRRNVASSSMSLSYRLFAGLDNAQIRNLICPYEAQIETGSNGRKLNEKESRYECKGRRFQWKPYSQKTKDEAIGMTSLVTPRVSISSEMHRLMRLSLGIELAG